MSGSSQTEQCELALETPAGRITTAVEVPTAFVPLTAIVPLARHIAEQSQTLDLELIRQEGQHVSCRQGCAACCRMLVPLSAPEAFALQAHVAQLPDEARRALHARLDRTLEALNAAGLLEPLEAVADTDRAWTDEELEPLNQQYYTLRLPCPFLVDEECSIYDHRPFACRDLMVTSPADWCDKMTDNPVQPVLPSIRMSTALGLLWAAVRQETPRLIPLTMALGWAERHQAEANSGGKGTELLDTFLDRLWRLLSQEFATRQAAPQPGQSGEG